MPALLGVYLDAGRAAMIGFFMAYFVDSLTGVGLVDQMGNFFCKTLLFVAVAGVLFIRNNEDLDKLKDLFDAWKEPDSSTVSEVSNFSFTLAAQDCEAALCLDPNHTETLHLYSRSKDQASSIDNTIFGLD